MKPVKAHWPIVAVLCLYGAVVALLGALALHRNGGHLNYALDDAYIHLAIAKNLSRYGVWGATQYQFSPSSSSILWTLLLAATDKVGLPLEWMPLCLNIGFGVGLLVFMDAALRRRLASPVSRFVVLAAAGFVIPVPALTFAAMEHLMHALFAVAFLEMAMREWDREPTEGLSTEARWLLILGPLAVAARYESAFLVAVVCAFFMFEKRRPRLAIAVGATALVPIVVFGVYSIRHGAKFVPNSVLLKSNTPHLSLGSVLHSLRDPAQALARNPDTLMLIVSTLALLLMADRLSSKARFSLKTLFAITLLHLLLARFGHFYRYEAYLFALWIFAGAAALLEARGEAPWALNLRADTRARWGALLGLFAAFPLLIRGGLSMAQIPGATHEIYTQQFQMARFLGEFYDADVVAANDIGVICYQSSVRIVDLAGLATMEVLEARRHGVFTTGKIDEITRDAGVKVAIVYDSWFEDVGGLPPRWTRVGQWKAQTMVVLGDTVVSIYAVDPAEAPRLSARLEGFVKELPPGVVFQRPPAAARAAIE